MITHQKRVKSESRCLNIERASLEASPRNVTVGIIISTIWQHFIFYQRGESPELELKHGKLCGVVLCLVIFTLQ